MPSLRRLFRYLDRTGDAWISWLLLALVVVLYVVRKPTFVNLVPIAPSDGPAKAAVDMAIEANKYLISLTTLLTGALAVGARMRGQRRRLSLVAICVSLTAALIFGFLTFARLTTELSQRQLAIEPNSSRVLFYLEMEFWCFLVASVCIASTLLFAWRPEDERP